jgi:hypothetical protein
VIQVRRATVRDARRGGSEQGSFAVRRCPHPSGDVVEVIAKSASSRIADDSENCEGHFYFLLVHRFQDFNRLEVFERMTAGVSDLIEIQVLDVDAQTFRQAVERPVAREAHAPLQIGNRLDRAIDRLGQLLLGQLSLQPIRSDPQADLSLFSHAGIFTGRIAIDPRITDPYFILIYGKTRRRRFDVNDRPPGDFKWQTFKGVGSGGGPPIGSRGFWVALASMFRALCAKGRRTQRDANARARR